MTVTSIHSRSADCRSFAIASTALAVACRTEGRGAQKCVTVSVRGEVDALNAKHFAHTVREMAGGSAALVLDLTEVSFLAFDGASALYAISAHLAREDVTWCVVPSPAVSRVVKLCDPEGLIPLQDIASVRGVKPA
ncbi:MULTISPECIES: STAS domain-containing protein [Mycolicibacterium]|uniref:Anti-sigma-factor antagonist n=2 Tax=Mycolicibacterium gilvum TaxID=1804 RepID=A0A378SUY0_9MYCO|nr:MULTISPECIES: STAS domain-containing protein [Mycolicibacterium]ABP44501.1 anti-sigma-factor antagonist [Mycolicibacterium gilvum PYR-GCK]MBV5244143.1 STAS domain-containing protein [Mycolicibacterium sp. PAM1]MCV7058428.1 STAS domain-containing protein [Mycolicibacterium gilvum]STZ45187.1 anti-sigma-factor antagonist [Mycolicibacterium gilvum]